MRVRQPSWRLTPTARRHVAEAAAIGIATGHNWMSNRKLPASVYVPVNIGVAASLMGLGRWAGASWADLGLDRDHVPAGVAVGTAVSAAAVLAVSRAMQRPSLQGWFADQRVITLGRREALFQAVIRIPVGTALTEELTFRGALTGLSLRHRRWPATAALTSALFGLWHVLPTFDTLSQHPLGQAALEAGRHRSAVLSGVLGTGLAGLVLSFLRYSTGSVVAPAMAHAAVNVAGFIAARILHVDRPRRPRKGPQPAPALVPNPGIS